MNSDFFPLVYSLKIILSPALLLSPSLRPSPPPAPPWMPSSMSRNLPVNKPLWFRYNPYHIPHKRLYRFSDPEKTVVQPVGTPQKVLPVNSTIGHHPIAM